MTQSSSFESSVFKPGLESSVFKAGCFKAGLESSGSLQGRMLPLRQSKPDCEISSLRLGYKAFRQEATSYKKLMNQSDALDLNSINQSDALTSVRLTNQMH
ncbi:hypothetical protein TNCV_3096031 [Trichonephila clavipes]|nr:hypothetical protein TNCV_3096031 [Trichonephila clavipes]